MPDLRSGRESVAPSCRASYATSTCSNPTNGDSPSSSARIRAAVDTRAEASVRRGHPGHWSKRAVGQSHPRARRGCLCGRPSVPRLGAAAEFAHPARMWESPGRRPAAQRARCFALGARTRRARQDDPRCRGWSRRGRAANVEGMGRFVLADQPLGRRFAFIEFERSDDDGRSPSTCRPRTTLLSHSRI